MTSWRPPPASGYSKCDPRNRLARQETRRCREGCHSIEYVLPRCARFDRASECASARRASEAASGCDIKRDRPAREIRDGPGADYVRDIRGSVVVVQGILHRPAGKTYRRRAIACSAAKASIFDVRRAEREVS